MKAGYARVSTKDQTVDLQVDALKKARLHQGLYRSHEWCTRVGSDPS